MVSRYWKGANHFEKGRPACPVGCLYCSVTEHDNRRDMWNANHMIGVNKACTFVNIPPWIRDDTAAAEAFYGLDFSQFKGDFLGFTAVTDPLWPVLAPFLTHFLEQGARFAKLITLVSKWPLSEASAEWLSQFPSLYLVVSITGNPFPIERVSVKKHLETLRLCRQYGIKALPLIHPYIAGVSDLSFLPALAGLGYTEVGVKGFRYDHGMAHWLPESSRQHYVAHNTEEILVEDGWREQVSQSGLSLLTPREWYYRDGLCASPNLSFAEAKQSADRILYLANIASSGNAKTVRDALIQRLVGGLFNVAETL